MKITILGAGNVGYHLALRLQQCGHELVQVWSRHKERAAEVTEKTGGVAIDSIADIDTNADIYLLAVRDDAIESLAEEVRYLNNYNKIIAHTSGTTPSDVFAGRFEQYGVFYPLQTFSREREANFDRLPFCVYSPKPDVEEVLEKLAKSICPNVHRINDEQRRVLHVGAVFVNNMTNYLFMAGEEICTRYQLPFELLRPLIAETVRKIENGSPSAMQTGPARRGDQVTLARHLAFLEKNNWHTYRDIYELMSKAIAEAFK